MKSFFSALHVDLASAPTLNYRETSDPSGARLLSSLPLPDGKEIQDEKFPLLVTRLFLPAKSTAADISTDAVTSSSESEVESECPSSLQASPRRNTRPPLQLPGSESLNPDAKGSQKGNTTSRLLFI